MAKAFVIMDYQNIVMGQTETYQPHETLKTIHDLAATARTQGHLVIYVQHNEANGRFDYGSKNWEFPSEIVPQEGDIVVHKQSCDAFRGTDFAEQLNNASIDHIFISGYATDFCVDTTVRRAASLGIKTTVFANAHTTKERPYATAETIITHHNWVWSGFTNPGNEIVVKVGDGDGAFTD